MVDLALSLRVVAETSAIDTATGLCADEIVTYSRKLMLGGISVVMGRGTMAQTYFVATVEAVYLMLHSKLNS
eukprot:COSAG02_NODE_44236_length_368_cov_0.565056_1_plen_71_part_10